MLILFELLYHCKIFKVESLFCSPLKSCATKYCVLALRCPVLKRRVNLTEIFRFFCLVSCNLVATDVAISSIDYCPLFVGKRPSLPFTTEMSEGPQCQVNYVWVHSIKGLFPPGVNFINILRAHFLYESALRSFSPLTFWFWQKDFGNESTFVRKMYV